jgi:hypothetical protein
MAREVGIYHRLTMLDSLADKQYKIETFYHRDNQQVAGSEGHWSSERSNYHVVTPVSDGSEFAFDVYFEGEHFFIYSGDMWRQGKSPHRIVEELSPLDHPFRWSKQLLQKTEKLEVVKEGSRVTYTARFDDMDDFDFRGILLRDQLKTTFIMVTKNGELQSMTFQAQPIKPQEVGVFASYPERITYEMTFASFDKEIPPISKEALESGQIE